jgi:hypothetical protein
MKQKLFFLMLTLFVLGSASVQAQVTIGADAPPHSSAVLDLQSTALGLKLPAIELGDVSVFQLSGTAEDADGIMIYNSSDATTGGSGRGIYVWNDNKWSFAGKSGQSIPAGIPAQKINITSAGFVTELNASGTGSTLQLTATVEPAEASQEVIWSTVYNPATTAGDVTVDATGLVTGVKAGTVTVRATATDGSGVYRNLALTVKSSSPVVSITVTPINATNSVVVDKTIQLEASVQPPAAYQTVAWSVDDTGIATVSTAGVVTGKAVGFVSVTATSLDGTNVASLPFQVEVTPAPQLATTPVEIGGNTYYSYVFQGVEWTVDNMSHGNVWLGSGVAEGRAYYNQTNAQDVCSGDFRLPTPEEATQLIAYLKSPLASTPELNAWYGVTQLQGYQDNGIQYFGTRSRYWANDAYITTTANPLEAAVNLLVEPLPARYGFAVRCVRNTD